MCYRYVPLTNDKSKMLYGVLECKELLVAMPVLTSGIYVQLCTMCAQVLSSDQH